MENNVLKFYKDCTICPRKCHIDRTKKKGFCQSTATLKIARAALHYYEEPSISGNTGSGTVFFSGCSLRCLFCQNKEISQQNFGKEISISRLAEIMLELEKQKANNINLVTPTHFVPSIIEAIKIARKKGLSIPIVYNSSGYEDIKTLTLLEGVVDIYLTDFKYASDKLANDLSAVKDYVKTAKEALEEMIRQTGPNKFSQNGLMKKGVIVRILVLPTKKEDAKNIISYLAKYKEKIYLSIMKQYTPNKEKSPYSFLNQTVTEEEYDEIIEYALNLGIENAYIQEGECCSESFIPKFDLTGVSAKQK